MNQKQKKKMKAAGARVRKQRLELGMTLETLAERLNCSISKVSAIERGISRPSVVDAKTLVAFEPSCRLTDWYPELEGELR